MGRVLKWSHGTNEADTAEYSLRPQRGAVVVLLPGIEPAQGRRCWRLSVEAWKWDFRWEAVAVPAGVVVVCSAGEDDCVEWKGRYVRAWVAPADLAEFPTRLVGATLDEIREYLYDGMLEAVVIRSEGSSLSGPKPPGFFPSTVERLPFRLLERFREAQRRLFRRGAVHPDGSAEFVAFAMSDRPFTQWNIEIIGHEEWRGAFPAQLGGRSGFAILGWTWTEGVDEAEIRVWWSRPLEGLRQETPGCVVGRESVPLTLAPELGSSVAGIW